MTDARTQTMQTDFLNNRLLVVSVFMSGTFLMHRIRNVLTEMVFKNSLGDQGTWLSVRPSVTYVYTLPRSLVAEHLAHPIG